jgi:predicted TIM-barrel fold metal-dependent hydrolase
VQSVTHDADSIQTHRETLNVPLSTQSTVREVVEPGEKLNDPTEDAQGGAPSAVPAAFQTPEGAWDCHAHVFENEASFPFSATRTFKPGHASLDMLRMFRQRLGLGKTVIVQASVYGADNSLMLDVLRRENGSARGIAVIDEHHTDSQLAEMHQVGVRGVRLNLETFDISDPQVALRHVRQLAKRVAPLNWHVQLYSNPALLTPLVDTLVNLPCPVVLDHFACLQAAQGVAQPGVNALLQLLASGNVWVKLSAPSRASQRPGHEDVRPLVDAMVQVAPGRLVWGSDWPHTGGLPKAQRSPHSIEPFGDIDDRQNAWQIDHWLPAALRHAFWVENPAQLYL